MKSIIYTLAVFATAAWALPPEDASEILFIKQEEKLARDVYQSLGEVWGTNVFLNITRSEQRHMDAVDGLIAQFGLTDPCPVEPGVFTIPELQELYDTLMLKGLQSETDALEVGVLVEVTDIEDLEKMIEQIDDASVDAVLGNLLRGSYNHLDAFNGVLGNGGGSGPAMRQRRAGMGHARFSWEGGNEGLGEPGAAATVALERSVAGSNVWTTVMDVTGLVEVVVAVDSSQHVLHRLRVETAGGTGAGSGGRGNGPGTGGGGPGSTSQIVYSNILSTHVLDTPWPDSEWWDGNWYETWSGWMEVSHYPWSYQNGIGWFYVVPLGETDAWAWNADFGWSYSAKSVYPWIYDADEGWLNSSD